MKVKLLNLLLILVMLSSCHEGAGKILANKKSSKKSMQITQYGKKVKFTEGYAIVFPDFHLTFNKEDYRPIDGHHGFIERIFSVQTSSVKTEVISSQFDLSHYPPAEFSIESCRYLLELGKSETLGFLDKSELVIQKISCY